MGFVSLLALVFLRFYAVVLQVHWERRGRCAGFTVSTGVSVSLVKRGCGESATREVEERPRSFLSFVWRWIWKKCTRRRPLIQLCSEACSLPGSWIVRPTHHFRRRNDPCGVVP